MKLGEILRGGHEVVATEALVADLRAKGHLSRREKVQLARAQNFLFRRRLILTPLVIGAAASLSALDLNPVVRAGRRLLTYTSTNPDNSLSNPPSEFIFPEGKIINQIFLLERNNFRSIIETSRHFPFAELVYPGRSPQLSFTKASSLQPVVEMIKSTSISVGENSATNLTFRLNFEKDVYAGPSLKDPRIVNNFSPAFLITFQEKQAIQTKGQAMVEFEGEKFIAPIHSITLQFPISYRSLYYKDTLLILNRGLLAHQPDRAVLFPVRLRLTPPTTIV